MPPETERLALGYITRARLSVIPVLADGTKKPAIPWNAYRQRVATKEELHLWYSRNNYGIAVVCGHLSGIEVLDFDQVGLYEKWRQALLDHDPELAEWEESLPRVVTPSGGVHLYLRCPGAIEGNQKLAKEPRYVTEGTDNARQAPDGRWYILDTLIETRGEGGYALLPGSPPECHPDNQPYRLVRGKLTQIPDVPQEVKRALYGIARLWNTDPAADFGGAAPTVPRARGESEGDRPGDIYNARVSLEDTAAIIEKAGYRLVRTQGEERYYLRPGKEQGRGKTWSATLNFQGDGKFRVFSSNCFPFDAEHTYTPFAVRALLDFGGDFGAAASACAAEGYVDDVSPRVRRALHNAAGETDAPPPSDADAPAPAPAESTPQAPGPPVLLADYNPTDAGNAERLIALHGRDLLFVRRLGWRTWNGRYWEAGEEAVLRIARETIRALYSEAAAMLSEARTVEDGDTRRSLVAKSEDLAKHALRSEQTGKLAAMVKQAASFTQITADPAKFHPRPWIVPFANGVWDRGEWREHRRDDFAERLLPVEYHPDADRSEWSALLDRITGGDAGFAALLQDVVGYALSAASSLRYLPWLYGPKGTGKSTVAELLLTTLGDYGLALDWALVGGTKSAEELGRAVRARRALFLAEAGKKRLDPEILKMLSGADSLPCREYYQGETFTISPSWAVIATSNDPPMLTAYDDALKDRVHALPFKHLIDGEGKPRLEFSGGRRLEEVRRDPLSALVRGFVPWAVEGLARVYEQQAIRGLEAADQHTRQFWVDADPLAPFWSEQSENALRLGVLSDALRQSYVAYCEREGIRKPLQGRAWGAACRGAGLSPFRDPETTRHGWRLPEGAEWPYDGFPDGLTDSGVFSDTFSKVSLPEGEFVKIPINPSGEGESVRNGNGTHPDADDQGAAVPAGRVRRVF